jgi:predicted ATPase
LRVRLLGEIDIKIGDQDIFAARHNYSMKHALIAALALAPGGALKVADVSRWLWEDRYLGDPAGSLNHLISSICEDIARVVGPETRPAYFARVRAPNDVEVAPDEHGNSRGWLVLCQAAQLVCDVTAFRALDEHARTSGTREDIRRALALYAGDLVPLDELLPHAKDQRAELRGRFDALCRRHSELAEVELSSLLRHGQRTRAEQLIAQATGAIAQENLLLDRYMTRLSKHLWSVMAQLAPPGWPHDAQEPSHTWPRLPVAHGIVIDRQQERAEVDRLVATEHLITLLGEGGSGKTTLGLEIARRLTQSAFEVVYYVRLDSLGVHDHERVAGQVAAALLLSEASLGEVTERIIALLRERRALLILDNCEHVLDGVQKLCHDLLRDCRWLHILTTSRVPLSVRGEVIYDVPGLHLPEREASINLELLRQNEAVRFFLAYARSQRPEFDLTRENAEAIVEICRQLDGLPLAIELAAKQVRYQRVEEFAASLESALQALINRDSTAPPRMRTMSAAIQWSYDLLGMSNPRAQRLFVQLAVFTGSFSADQAAQIRLRLNSGGPRTPATGAESRENEVQELLKELVHASLLEVETSGHQTRYRQLEVIRQFALSHLVREGHFEWAAKAHAWVYFGVAEKASKELKRRDQIEWLDRLAADHENLRTAIIWACDHGEIDLALGMVGALWRFWWIRSYLAQGSQLIDRALKLYEALPEASAVQHHLAAEALGARAIFASEQGRFAEAWAWAKRSVDLRKVDDDWAGLARSLSIAGMVAYSSGNPVEAQTLLEESLAIRRQLDDPAGIGMSLKNLATAAYYLGRYDDAAALLQQSHEHQLLCGDLYGLGYTLINQGNIWLRRGLDERGGEACFTWADALYLECLAIRWLLRARSGIASCLQGMVVNATAQGRYHHSAWLLGVETMLSRKIGLELPMEDRELYRNTTARIQKGIGNPFEFEDCKREGREARLSQALACLLLAGAPTLDHLRTDRLAPYEQLWFTGVRARLRQECGPQKYTIATMSVEGRSAKEIAAHLRISGQRVAESQVELAGMMVELLRREVDRWVDEHYIERP